MHGGASLTFGVRNGRTSLLGKRVQPPLAVQRALYLDEALPDMAFVFLSNPTAGVLGGDEQTIVVELGPGAKAHVCSHAATKVFSMPEGCAGQSVFLTLREGAYLEYMPDAVIPFRDSRYSQETVINVVPGATLLFSEIVCPGRVEMGECFAFKRFSSRLTVAAPGGGPLYREAFSLEPGKHHPGGIGVMGSLPAPSLGTLLLLDRTRDAEGLRDRIRDRVGRLQEQGWNFRSGASLLPNGLGVALKILGEPAAAVSKVLQVARAEVRREVLGVDTLPMRKF